MGDETQLGAVKHDIGKARWELLPYDALGEVAKVMTHGAEKYGARNWEKGFRWTRVFGSLKCRVRAA